MGDVSDKRRTSMMFSCRSSRRNLISLMADMSSPSLNWPTLIFLMAISRPVAISRPDVRRSGWERVSFVELASSPGVPSRHRSRPVPPERGPRPW